MAKDTDKAAADSPKEEATKFVNVKSGLPKRNGADVVALWEVDPSHPGGEAYVAGDKSVKVALTPEVNKRIREATLIEV
jgi:hypothetical protein